MAEINEEETGSDSDIGTRTGTPNMKQFLAVTESNKTLYRLKGKESEKVQKILRKVKLALQQSEEKRKKGKKSRILICYHRQSKKKNENQPKRDQESMSSTPGNAPSPPGATDLK
ncbi:uncharacterized protein LOC113931421 isoform X1 [Zalophus californianus]|uniref:Uncharacterized protein LOC113931421 isoform X1 n=1 Tax=Zalophus californianus TaxID=9704 RepID=A0A6J2EAC6_ZALCA|nr:uncharacterized protein LOC113931421 isoform X1 [Zalophus californianus]